MPQFLIPPGSRERDIVALDDADARHLRDVLRAEIGEKVRLSDGHGAHYQGEVRSISKQSVSVLVASRLSGEAPHPSLLFAQSILKGDKMELVLQKAAELGADSFLPFVSSRTIPKIDPRKDKITRWRKIAQEASKQCGRATHMIVTEPVTFERLVAQAEATAKIVFWEDSQESLRVFFGSTDLKKDPTASIIALIGPEGGFSKDEIDLAIRHGFKVLSLGRLVLRAETAAITSMSLIQYELGRI